jgi:hypothetical protein
MDHQETKLKMKGGKLKMLGMSSIVVSLYAIFTCCTVCVGLFSKESHVPITMNCPPLAFGKDTPWHDIPRNTECKSSACLGCKQRDAYNKCQLSTHEWCNCSQ